MASYDVDIMLGPWDVKNSYVVRKVYNIYTCFYYVAIAEYDLNDSMTTIPFYIMKTYCNFQCLYQDGLPTSSGKIVHSILEVLQILRR